MHIMRQHNRPPRVQTLAEMLNAVVYTARVVVRVVLGVEVRADNVVAQVGQGGEHAVVDFEEGRAHVGWDAADVGLEGGLEGSHFFGYGVGGDPGEVGVGEAGVR